MCFRRTVRCMLLQLESVPKISTHNSILDLRFNKIRDVPPGTFKGLKHLNTLLLNNNQLTSLKDGAFIGLANLRYLYLYKNHINYLDANVFQGLPKLEQLYLHFNEIREFDPNTFSNLPSLDRLFLHNNRLEHIPPGSFTEMPKLRRLRLDSNALICDCQMFWLAKLLNNSSIQAAASCQAPNEMYGKSLKGMNARDFHCIIPHIMEGPQDVEVSWGGTVIFKCRVDSSEIKPQIIWMRDSLKLPDKGDRYAIMEDGSLKIVNSQDTDIGQYECMAITPEGEIKSRPARMIVTKPEINGRPKFVLTPEDQTANVGTTELRLKCQALGDPRPQMSWSHNGVQLGLTIRHQMEPEGTLIIRNISASDYGIYRCEAANNLGRINANAQVKINSPPLFTVHPENLQLKTGSRAVLECQAVGTPSPTITWYRHDREIFPEGRIALEADSSRLVIQDVKESDSGLYVCQARNILGFRDVSANLEVKAAIENPPKFIYQPYDIIAYPRTTIELPCRAEGEPEPDIAWRRDGTSLERNPQKYRISGSGSLYIYELSDEDSGRYECTATNEYGRVSANGLVTLKQDFRPGGARVGDQFVRIAFAEASKEVDTAINKTVNRLFGEHLNPPSPSDLFRIIRFPNAPARELARAAEVYERTLINIRKHVNEGRKMSSNVNLTDFDYKEILSPAHLELVAQLSGCMAHRPSSNCTDMCFHSKYRSISGLCNNLQNPTWGASLTGFRRILKPIYENGFSMPVGWTKGIKYNGFEKPSSRLISTTLIATKEISQDEHITHMVMQWGQFLDHDLDHAIPSVSSESWDGIDCKKSCEYASPCYPIDVPPNDPRIRNRRCIDFVRSSAICGSGMTSVFFDSIAVQPREQINQLTSFIDASQVYGFSDELAQDLRDVTNDLGHLREGPIFPNRKALLPYAAGAQMDCRRDLSESNINCFLAGDIRANEQVGLLVMHTVWMREHNRIADELRRINPQWDGEKIYQESRKIIGALAQHITYAHWLPHILGDEGMTILGSYKSYDPSIHPSISNVFATAALRFGHSLINPILHRLNSSFLPIPEGHLPLHKAFFSPWRVVDEGGVDPLLRGLFTVPAKLKKPNQNLNTELTEQLFKVAHAVALDLAAINIHRSRDHAIPGYLEFRKFCNLSSVETFEDLRSEISDYEVRRKLQELYGHPGNIDVWVGGILEDQVKGGRVGPLFRCLLIEQFRRLRDGDRFFYENPSSFKPEQLAQIKQGSLSRLLCDSADSIEDITPNVFLLPKKQGGYIKCQNIPRMDLRMWTECCEGCSNPGQFNSLNRFNRNSRSRRDAEREGFSYPSDMPTIYNNNATMFSDFTDLKEEENEARLEGIEDIVLKMQKTINQMKKEIKKLKSIQTDKHCLDVNGKLWKNHQSWKVDSCTKCTCKDRYINCTEQKCPEMACENTIVVNNQCCPICA